MSELNQLLDAAIADAQKLMQMAKGMEAQREQFAMGILEIQRSAFGVLKQTESWDDPESLDPDELVDLIKMQSELLIDATDQYVRAATQDRAFFERIAATYKSQLELYEADKALNVEKEELLVKLRIMDDLDFNEGTEV